MVLPDFKLGGKSGHNHLLASWSWANSLPSEPQLPFFKTGDDGVHFKGLVWKLDDKKWKWRHFVNKIHLVNGSYGYTFSPTLF